MILIGTYWDGQFKKWKGYYNYPISDADKVEPEKINELWLFNGNKQQRTFVAEFVGVKTRKELVAEYQYPAKGSGHGDKYLLFKIKRRLQPSKTADGYFVRTKDFSGRSPKIAAQLKAYLESPDRKNATLAARLPRIVTKLPASKLIIGEEALQMDFLGVFEDETKYGVLPKFVPVIKNVECVFSNEQGSLYQGDSVLWLRGLPSASVDMAFADPPYSIGKAEWDCFKSHESYLSWCEEWIGEVSRVLRDDGTCYICGFSEILADVKYRTQKFFNGCRWIVWHYKNKANLGNDWGRSHESILHFRKLKTTRINVDDIRIPYNAHTLKYPDHPQSESSAYGKGSVGAHEWKPNARGAKPKDVFDIPTTCNGMGEKTPHPTQKPEELLRKLVLASSNIGDVVIDPFSGSGTTAVVAQQLQRKWMVCDRNSEYNAWAKARLGLVKEHPIGYWIDLDREIAKRRESIR